MPKTTLKKRHVLIAGASFALTALAATLYAGGFQLQEQDASGLGEYHAGQAAKANNAATEFYNPAGMVRLKHMQVSTGVTMIRLSTHFKGTTQVISNILPQPPVAASGNGSTTNYVPNFHFVAPFSLKGHSAAFGFGVTTPFGLSTIYPYSTLKNQIGVGGTNTTIETINIAPSFAYALTPKISIGGGIDFMMGIADYNNDEFVLGGYARDTNHLEGNGWGYNLGVLWQPTTSTRVGFAYRSRVTIKAQGQSTSDLASGPTTASAVLPLPASLTLSAYQQINKKWSAAATASYTQWSVFKSLTLTNLADPFAPNPTVVKFDYKDSWFGALGTKYWITPHNAFSVGLGYDQTPTRDGYRDTRLPDGNRWIGSVGWQYKLDQQYDFSVGYAYIDMGKAKIDNSKAGGPTVSKGTSNGHANVVGMQLSYKFM